MGAIDSINSVNQITTVSISEIPSIKDLNRDHILLNEGILGIIFSFGDKIGLTGQSLVNHRWNRVLSNCLKRGLDLQLLKADFYEAQRILIARNCLDKQHRVALGDTLPSLVLNLCEDSGYLTEDACKTLKESDEMTMEVLDKRLLELANSSYFHLRSEAIERGAWNWDAVYGAKKVLYSLHQNNVRCVNKLAYVISMMEIDFNLDKDFEPEFRENAYKLSNICSRWIPEDHKLSSDETINCLRIATLIANRIPISILKGSALAKIADCYAKLGKLSKSVELLKDVNEFDVVIEERIGAIAVMLIRANQYENGINILKTLKKLLPLYCELAYPILIDKKQYLLAIQVSHLIPTDSPYAFTCNNLKQELMEKLFFAKEYDLLESILKEEGCLVDGCIVASNKYWLDRFLSNLARKIMERNNPITLLRDITSISLRDFFCSKIFQFLFLTPGKALEAENIADMIKDPKEKENCLQLLPLYSLKGKFLAYKGDPFEFLKQIKSSFMKNNFFPLVADYFLCKDDLLQAEQVADMIEDPIQKAKSFQFITIIGKSMFLTIAKDKFMEILKQIRTVSLKDHLLPQLVEQLVLRRDKIEAEEIANMIADPVKKKASLELISPPPKEALHPESTPVSPSMKKIVSQAPKPIKISQPQSKPAISVTIMSRMTYATTSLAKLWHRSFSFKLLSIASLGLIPLITFLFKLIFNKPQV